MTKVSTQVITSPSFSLGKSFLSISLFTYVFNIYFILPGVSKKYRCLICYTVKTGRAVSLKWTSLNSERPNLNFDI